MVFIAISSRSFLQSRSAGFAPISSCCLRSAAALAPQRKATAVRSFTSLAEKRIVSRLMEMAALEYGLLALAFPVEAQLNKTSPQPPLPAVDRHDTMPKMMSAVLAAGLSYKLIDLVAGGTPGKVVP